MHSQTWNRTASCRIISGTKETKKPGGLLPRAGIVRIFRASPSGEGYAGFFQKTGLESVVEFLEVGLRMMAGGADFGGFLAADEAAAVAAAPHGFLLTLEHGAFLHHLEQSEIALFVELLSHGDVPHDSGDFRKTFLFSDVGESGIHAGPLFILAGSGGFEVLSGALDGAGGVSGGDFNGAAFEELEQTLGVFLLLQGGFSEDIGDQDKAVFLGLGSEVIVTVAGLGFTGESGEDVLFGLGALERFHSDPPGVCMVKQFVFSVNSLPFVSLLVINIINSVKLFLKFFWQEAFFPCTTAGERARRGPALFQGFSSPEKAGQG